MLEAGGEKQEAIGGSLQKGLACQEIYQPCRRPKKYHTERSEHRIQQHS
jgi:hypothetical protein